MSWRGTSQTFPTGTQNLGNLIGSIEKTSLMEKMSDES
jgi:hypothetical protein